MSWEDTLSFSSPPQEKHFVPTKFITRVILLSRVYSSRGFLFATWKVKNFSYLFLEKLVSYFIDLNSTSDFQGESFHKIKQRCTSRSQACPKFSLCFGRLSFASRCNRVSNIISFFFFLFNLTVHSIWLSWFCLTKVDFFYTNLYQGRASCFSYLQRWTFYVWIFPRPRFNVGNANRIDGGQFFKQHWTGGKGRIFFQHLCPWL